MKKWKVSYDISTATLPPKGEMYVEADTKDEAENKVWDAIEYDLSELTREPEIDCVATEVDEAEYEANE